MAEDDFGELYGDQVSDVSSIGAGSLQKSYSGFSYFDDEIEEDKDHVGAPVVPTPPVTKHQAVTKHRDALFIPNPPAEHDSDEDDDMLLLGYNSKSGSAASKLQANDTQAMVTNDPEAEFAKFAELAKVGDITENGSVSLSPNAAVCVPGITPSQELALTGGHNLLNGSSDATSHTVTIPGLSTTVKAPFFDMGESGDATQDDWEQRQIGNTHMRPGGDVAVEGADDWDTDSDDDLRIVLNTEYPFYSTGEKGAVGRYEGASEDEDDEDLIIFAGDEHNEEVDDKLLQSVDGQALQGDGLGDKQTGLEDGKAQQDKILPGIPAPPQALRGYGYHNYNSPYKYVRAGATAVYNASGGQTLGGRGGLLKVINGRGDWRGSGRGLFGSHSASQFWSTNSSCEYTLPPSMTVFDIDLEAFDDKPWRQPTVDVSDFFNFGFDETTWKDYCKQLAQLRLESTLQSKIRVYESGRTEQDYDPDLPPELALAAGVQEVVEKAQQRLGESDTTVLGMGRRGYTPMIPLGRPIEVEGGLGDRRPSADSRKQRVRDSDSILLIDAVEIEDLEREVLQDDNTEGVDGEVSKDEMDDEQQQEDDQVEEEEEQLVVDPRAAFKTRQEQHLWRKDQVHGMKNNKGPTTNLNIEKSQKSSEGNPRTGYDSMAVSTGRNMQPHFLSSNASEPSKLSGELPAQRDHFSRPKSTIKPLAEERRELDLTCSRSASLCQDAESNPKSGTGEGESDFKKLTTDRDQQPHSRKQSYAGDEISAEERQDGQSAGRRMEESNTAASREVHKSPREVQVESSGCSSKRQRLVSPEGSQTASWDNYAVAKSGRSGAIIKESRDSADSAMDAREDSSHHRKKHRSYPEMSRGDHYRESRQDSESHRKKKSSILERRDVDVEGHPRADSLQDARKRPKQMIVTSKESSRHWKDRDGSRRDEDGERKGYSLKETLHHKDKSGNRSESRKKDEDDREAAYYRDRGGNRPESRRKEELEKRDKQDSRRRDAEDRRERFEKGSVHRENKDNHYREKELEPPNYLERRKKDDDYRRKDRSEEGSDYSKKEREKNASERHDRESGQHSRRREDESWKKENFEDHYRAKARDGSLKDSEDSRQRNTEYQGEDSRQRNTEHQESHGRVHKDEERAVQTAKSSRRHDETRSWRGRNDSRLSDSRSAEPRSHSKDRRKDLDDHGKDKSRSHARSATDREGLQALENHDRDSLKRSRMSDDTRTHERGSHSDKHKSAAKRSRDLDKESNDLASQPGDHSNASRRKKAVSDKTELAMKKRLEDPMTVRSRDSQATASRSHIEEIKEPTIIKSGKTSKVRHFDAEEAEEDAQQKGRSKLERWMSHKDTETVESERLIAQSKLKKDEKPKQSSTSRDKQHRDLSVLHEGIDHENKQHAGVERKGGKISASEEQVNGRVAKVEEKGAAVAQSKDVDGDGVDKGFVEFPEHHEEDSVLPRTNMAAKLEKRKERFKVHVEGKESLQKQDYEDIRLIDKDDSRQERPPRKRRWASG